MDNLQSGISLHAPPMSAETPAAGPLGFVVRRHVARSHAYLLHLEYQGALKSWVLPKGLPYRSGDRRLAFQVEDHPLAQARPSGVMPAGSSAPGELAIWDGGSYELRHWSEDAITFSLHGRRLHGTYELVRVDHTNVATWLVCRTSSMHAMARNRISAQRRIAHPAHPPAEATPAPQDFARKESPITLQPQEHHENCIEHSPT